MKKSHKPVVIRLGTDKKGKLGIYVKRGNGPWKLGKFSNRKLPKRNGFLIVRAGIEGEWEPTQGEMIRIGDLFATALGTPGCAVAIRNGIDVWWQDLPDPVDKSARKI